MKKKASQTVAKSVAKTAAKKRTTPKRSVAGAPAVKPAVTMVPAAAPEGLVKARARKHRVTSAVSSKVSAPAKMPGASEPAERLSVRAMSKPETPSKQVSAPQRHLADRAEKTDGNEVARRHGEGTKMRSQISQEHDALAPYVRIAQKHPPLTREREFALSAAARGGDAKARQLLINHNLAFVLSMCRRYANKGCRLDDLVQEGMIGLLKAVEHFDPARGNRFSTYASWWIRAYVQKYLRDMRATVKPIVAQPGQERFALPRDFSLDAPIGDDDDTTHLDRLEDGGPSQEDRYLRDEHSEEVRDALERIRKRLGGLGWDIVRQRLEEETPRTLEEIGKDWGLSRERVRQVEKSTRSFLERYLESFAA
jgi:RNA polymerase primary sigma factor